MVTEDVLENKNNPKPQQNQDDPLKFPLSMSKADYISAHRSVRPSGGRFV